MAGKKGRSGGHNLKTRGLHLVDGTLRKHRHGSVAEVRAEVTENRGEPVPSAPRWLSREARAEWRRVAKKLHKRGDLGSMDRSALAAYCQAWSEFMDAERGRLATLNAARAALLIDPADADSARIVAYGATVVPGKEDGWVRNPAVVVVNAAAKRMLDAAREFGMTPIARARRAAAGSGGDSSPAGADFPEDLADDAAGA